MSNQLTGNYEASVQISTRLINGLLATLHQNGGHDDKPLKLIHSATLRVGDPPASSSANVTGDFANWVRDLQIADGPRPLDKLRTDLTATVPPGAAKMLAGAFAKIGQGPGRPPPAGKVRGTVRVQIATPTLSLTAGSTSEVTLVLGIRADYTPDPGTLNVVEPGHYVHGDVHAAFEVTVELDFPGQLSPLPETHALPPHLFLRRRLVVRPSSQDSKIFFVAAQGSNLSVIEVAQISDQVRKAIREGITTLPVDLPSGFPFSEFKGLGNAPDQALALPLQLSGAAAPAGGLQSVSNPFAGPAGFAIGISEEYVKSVFKPTTDNLKAFTLDVRPSFLGFHPTYHFSVTDARLQFSDGSIDLIVNGKAHTDDFVPPVVAQSDYDNIVVTQRVTLILFLNSLFIIARDDGVTVSGLPDQAVGAVKSAIAVQRSNLLPPVQDDLNTRLLKARTDLTDALSAFDDSPLVSFRSGTTEDPGAGASGAIAITPDGVILRGDIGSSTARDAPVVNIAETPDHTGFTALESWIPGGRVDKMTWSWVEYSNPSIYSGATKFSSPPALDAQRFVLPKPPGITQLSSICLSIEGTRTLPDGQIVSGVAGGTTCHVPNLGNIMDVPSWWEPVTVPFWSPDTAADAILKEAIAGHVSVQGARPGKDALTHNTLVYFADWRKDKPLEPLARAFSLMQRKSYSLVVIVVTPAGTFDSRRREVEARLDMGREHPPIHLLPAEDNEGGWTKTFAVSKTPSAYLINALGKFAWQHGGEADPKALAAALDANLTPAPAPQSRPLRLADAPCGQSMDFTFEDDQGRQSALHRLRGREVLLNFWQGWSAPCIKELLRLQTLQKKDDGSGPFIIAFHGGKEQKLIGEIRKQHGLTIPLAQDTDQRIARLYGVRCWPTTISVNADGRTGHVQFGVAREQPRPAKGKKAGSS